MKIAAGIAGAFVLLIVIVSVASNGGGSTGSNAGVSASSAQATAAAAAPPAAQPSHKPARQTVTYVVQGSAADVTYGPEGSNFGGSVPMRVTKHLGHPQYYAISAQLNGAGSVTCKILVDGKVISKATATGGYNIADCEISPDPFSGKWEDTNSQ